MKKSPKIFITHFHKTFYLVIKKTFFCEFSYVFFNSLPHTQVLTLRPPCTLFISSRYLRLDVLSKDSHTSTGYTGYISMVSPNCVFWDEWPANLLEFKKKQNAFSAWWCGMGSHHRRQSFCLPGHPALTPGNSCHLIGHEFFSFCGHVQHWGLSIIDLTYSQKQSIIDHVEWPDLACQRHKIIVRHIFNPFWILYNHASIWIYGHWFDWVWGGLSQKLQVNFILPWSSACPKLCPKDLAI